MKSQFIIAVTMCTLAGCQLISGKSVLKSSTKDTEAKALADTIALGLSYPYEREAGSYLFVNGEPYLYEHIGTDPLVDGTLKVEGKTIQVDSFLKELSKKNNVPLPDGMDKRTPIIAYGSNAAVSALKRKFMTEKFARGWSIIPVLKGSLKDFEIVHAAHFVPVNGSFPAGIAYQSGAESEVWMTYLDAQEMERMHASEGIDKDSPESWYSYGRLDNIKIQIPGWKQLTSAFVYVDNYGSLLVNNKRAPLSKVPGAPVSPQVSMEQALESAEGIFTKSEISPETAATCKSWKGIEKRLCENIADPCLRDERTDALVAEKRIEKWQVPTSSGPTYERLAGAEKAGHPKAFPDSMRCAKAGK